MDLFGQNEALQAEYESDFDDLDFKNTIDDFAKNQPMVIENFWFFFTCVYHIT